MNLTFKTLMFALLLSGCADAADDRDEVEDEQTSPGDRPEPGGKTKDAAATEGEPRSDAGPRPDAALPRKEDASVSTLPVDAAVNRPDSTVIGPKDDPFSGFPGAGNTGFKPMLVGTGFTTAGPGASIKYDAQAYDAKLMTTLAGCVLTIAELMIHNTITGAGDVYLGDVLIASGGKCVVDSVPAKP